jgi:hypothetical protein
MHDRQRFICNNFYINISEDYSLQQQSSKLGHGCLQQSNDYTAFEGETGGKGPASRNQLRRPTTSLRERPRGRLKELPGAPTSVKLRTKLCRQESLQEIRKGASRADVEAEFFKFMQEELHIPQRQSESAFDLLNSSSNDAELLLGAPDSVGNLGENELLEQRQRLNLKDLHLLSEEQKNAQEDTQKKGFRIKKMPPRGSKKTSVIRAARHDGNQDRNSPP